MFETIPVDEVRDRELMHRGRRLSGRVGCREVVSDIDSVEQSGNLE
ncbi:hypothetical protein [Mesorhizobium sp. 43Arga]